MLQETGQQAFVVDGHGHTKLRPGAMKKAPMTAGVIVNIKSSVIGFNDSESMKRSTCRIECT
jgi:hypothetical protein